MLKLHGVDYALLFNIIVFSSCFIFIFIFSSEIRAGEASWILSISTPLFLFEEAENQEAELSFFIVGF